MRPARLTLCILALGLLLATFSMEAGANSAYAYFDRATESVGQGGSITYYVMFDNYPGDWDWLYGGYNVYVSINNVSGTAVYNTDYTGTFGGTPLNNGSGTCHLWVYRNDLTHVTIPVVITANNTVNSDVNQTFSVEVTGIPNAYPGWPNFNTLNIDKLPTTQFQAVQRSIDEGTALTDIAVIRTGATYVPSTVDVTSTSNAARGGSYTVSPSTISFGAGDTTRYITVSTTDDGFFNNDYNITLTLQNPSGARLVEPVNINVTVISTTSAPTVQFRDVAESVVEGGGVDIKLARTGDIANTASTVRLQANVSTTLGDYTVSPNNISLNNYNIDFEKGETEKTITINAGTNGEYDDTRDVRFSLTAVNGGKAVIGPKDTSILTIVDNTPLPVVDFAGVSEHIDEGGIATIALQRTGATNVACTVDIAYSLATGDVGGNYSVNPKYTVQFGKDESTANITVTTRDDVVYGNDYHVSFTLSNPGTAVLGTNTLNVLTVYDTTPLPAVQFLMDNKNVKEGNNTTLTLVRTGAQNIQSSVSCSFNQGLSANTNFKRLTPMSGTIVFSPNETTKTVDIHVNADDMSHQGEVAYYELGDASNAVIGTMDHVLIDIVDLTERQPQPPDVYFASGSAGANSGETCDIIIRRSANSVESNVILERIGGTASPGVDYNMTVELPYTVRFAVGENEQKVTVSVSSATEGEKSFVLGLDMYSTDDAVPASPSEFTLNIHGITPPPPPTPTPTPTPTPAPDIRPLYVNANLDTDQIVVGYEGKITITVTDGLKPVSGAAVSIDKSGGQVIMLNPKTDGNGVCYATFKSDNPGQYSLTITATGAGYDPGTASLSTSVVTAIPGALTVNAMVKQQPVVIGSEAEVSINVLDGGTPVPGAAVTIETTSGSVTPASGTTNGEGNMFATFHSGDPGSYILTVTATASGHPTSRVSYAVQVVGAEERHLYATMSVDPKTVDPNSRASVTVTVTDGVMPVSNAQVSLVSTGGTIAPASGVTDEDGKFVADFEADSEGTYTLGANVFSEGIGQASYSTYIKVKQNMFDLQTLLYFIAAVVIIAIVLIILAALIEKWLAYDLRIIPKMGAIPADGMSRLPVRIETFNGFGRPKKARSDTYVELESTAGRIESVTIPSGRNYADAVLASSKEFGPVTINAKLGDKATASVPVEFKLEGGSLAVTINPGMIIADSKSSASINVRIRNSKGNYVVPLSDKIIELNTTLGDIVGSIVNMPARANSANATIVSNKEGGIAMVTATMGTLKGTGRVEFRSMSRQLCQNCGQPIPGSLPVCPSCGAPAVSADDKRAAASMN